MFGWLAAAAKARNLVPRMSATEREALEAGTVWVDGELFSGRPDFARILREPYPQLSP
jgi:acyl-CoA dehydrogenase